MKFHTYKYPLIHQNTPLRNHYPNHRAFFNEAKKCTTIKMPVIWKNRFVLAYGGGSRFHRLTVELRNYKVIPFPLTLQRQSEFDKTSFSVSNCSLNCQLGSTVCPV
jgi:hypothetical protein